jgi:peptidoglycan glycosyltransferase
MPFEREINRLLIGLMLLFVIVAAAAAYWSAAGAETILQMDENPRRVLAEAALRRGAIFDRTETVLAASVLNDDGTLRREYYLPSTYSAVGYSSLTYGVAGAEAAYDSVLRGDDLALSFDAYITDLLLHRPQRGSDVQLTLDADVQDAVTAAMNGQRGAALVLSIPSGDVMAMLSAPTFDPNTLDDDWDRLSTDAGNPFFNRALQGRYQPGAVLQSPLIAAALLLDISIDQPVENATSPYLLNALTLNCAVRLPEIALTLRDAYSFACPNAFASLIDSLEIDVIQATFDTFQIESMPTLEGYIRDGGMLTPTPIPFQWTLGNFRATALGQGDQTVTPLLMAMIAAAIVNDGNTPQPGAILNTRTPGSTEWTPVVSARPTVPITTSETARRLQDLMRAAVANGAAQNAGRPNLDIGGHAALAYTGDSSLAWFIGFATLGGNDAIAVVVVLENSDDAGLAADIGGTALETAARALREQFLTQDSRNVFPRAVVSNTTIYME